MARRLHTPRLFVGQVPLDSVQARHAREVLRLPEGATIDVFDDRGATASGRLVFLGARATAVNVEHVALPQPASGLQVVVASAVPKGERADWMVEKLSELGVSAFIPLATVRSVVLPEGKGKHERWLRIATESAKQSRRAGVMRIEMLSRVDELLRRNVRGFVLSTEPDAAAIVEALGLKSSGELVLFVGPEGGWTGPEMQAFQSANIQSIRLTDTVLRVETAALAAAAVISVLAAR